VRLKINLKKLLGKSPSDELKDAIAQKAIDLIEERTKRQKGVKDQKLENFPKYSKEYAKEKGSKKVDLTLSGDMLGLMDVVKETKNTIEIGWEDDTENAKAFNHTTGDTLPKRNFFDLTKREVTKLKDFAKDFDDE